MGQEQPTLLTEADIMRGCVAGLKMWFHFSPDWEASITHILLYTKWQQPSPSTSWESWNQRRFALSSPCLLLTFVQRLLWAKPVVIASVLQGIYPAAPQSYSHLVGGHSFTTEWQPSCQGTQLQSPCIAHSTGPVRSCAHPRWRAWEM